jgi:hypothetical protein
MALRPLYAEFWDWLWSNYPKRPWLQTVPDDHWILQIRKFRVLMAIPAAIMLCLFLGYYLLLTYWPLCVAFALILVFIVVTLIYYLDRRRRENMYFPPPVMRSPAPQGSSYQSEAPRAPVKSTSLDPKCPHCGTVVGPRTASCWSCGKMFDDWCPECLSPYPKGTTKCAQCSELVK